MRWIPVLFLFLFLILIGRLSGCLYTRVSFTTHKDIKYKDGQLINYKWYAVGIHKNGHYTCVDTFSELTDPDAKKKAEQCHRDVKAKLATP